MRAATRLEPRALAALAAAACAALLIAALGFQYLGGLAPCPLCIWQRWPHLAGAALGALAALALGRGRARAGAACAGLGAVAMATGLGVAAFHVGVEQGWWDSATCAAPAIGGRSTDELLADIMKTPLTRCDEVPWSLLGLSMAGWNAAASLVLGCAFATAARGAVRA